jgi:hypothetical protein
MLLHAKSNAIGKHIDAISFKGRYYHIAIVSLFLYFSVLLSSKKIRKATQEIFHSLSPMAKKLFCFAPLFYICRIFMQQKLQNLSFLVEKTAYYFNFI